MYTGIATGAVNAGVYNAVGWIDRRMKLEKWDVSLDADFNNADVYKRQLLHRSLIFSLL